jgi:TPR repeat protein
MTRYFLALVLAGLIWSASAPAQAELKYYPDPVYRKLNADDHMPMDDILDLARGGDVRAMFIMGDLYAKGKGGMAQDLAEARHWFEESAIHGYSHSFIRLATLAKRANKPAEAWQWYTLAINDFDSGDDRYKYAKEARKALEISAKLSDDDLRRAEKSLDAWEDMRDRKIEEEEKAAREKERLQKEQPTPTGVTENEQNKGQNAPR